ncbi:MULTISPECIES: hypothetical protein [unclassified Streptomyces]|uniref:hypothetical protein n=1 Tax=unclassified Streptomyces TaxID=2593676 RepID=UPI001908810D|nr:hypothetical protein [Streptomyces sp. HSG2]
MTDFDTTLFQGIPETLAEGDIGVAPEMSIMVADAFAAAQVTVAAGHALIGSLVDALGG